MIARRTLVTSVTRRAVTSTASSTTTSNATTASTTTSTCPAGTKLNGLNYLKQGQDPVAKDDSEYPSWLWQLTEQTSSTQLSNRQTLKQQSKQTIKAKNTLKG
ncbi:hypothetical protein OIO90_001568 [Microbotryomycetes sp. JL221]|nr:hypothetical protein OIO90_001568 [Microbotryomycetes sp. JL221]